MLTTEEEAKTKRCQEAFAAGERMYADGPTFLNPIPEELRKYHPVGVTHTTTTYAPVNCIGSACMAWRWGGAMGNHEDGTGKMFGYCGKAGRP